MDTKRIGDQTTRESFYYAAIYGAIAWTIYAIVESCFSTIFPWIITPGTEYKPLHWGLTVLLFVLYPIFGLILGGLFGLCIRTVSERIPLLKDAQFTVVFSAAAIATLVSAFAVNLVIHSSFNLSVSAIVLICILLIFGILLSVRSDTWSKRLCVITNPWTCCIIILGLPWIFMELLVNNDSKVIKAGVVFIYVFAVLLISFIVQRTIRTRATHSSPTRSFVFLVPAILIILGFSFFLKQAPLTETSHLNPSPLKSDNPNVILITMDTVRADHLSLYGYERDTTPNLRNFSEEATLYTNAIASGALTLSTHASIFTGLYARQHGAHCSPNSPNGRPLAGKFRTLAEFLSEKGYSTVGVVANRGYLTHHFGFVQGFQYYDNREKIMFLHPSPSYYIRNAIRKFLTFFALRSQLDSVYRRAEDINNEIFSLIDKIVENKNKFFLFVNYMDAHQPYIPPSPYDKLYPGKDKTFTSAKYYKLLDEVMELKRRIKDEEYHHLISQYDGEIAYIDYNIGELFKRLKKVGLYENSIIIITSDHGEAFGERNLMNHGVSVYQDQVYIPLIIKYPERGHKIVDGLVSVVDIMPTILDALDYKIPKTVVGKSLLEFKNENYRSIISESYPEGDIRQGTRFDRDERAIFFGHFKFINSTAGKKELYDLSKDPNEKKNLSKAKESKATELEAKLNQWLKDTKEESGTAAKLDKDALERLKALGYIQ